MQVTALADTVGFAVVDKSASIFARYISWPLQVKDVKR